MDLDSDQIASGKTGKLVAVLIAASVALKGVLSTVLNGAPTTRATFFSPAGKHELVLFPSREFITQPESGTAGFDGFRITATNLDTTQAADAYATFFYDEM